MSGPGSRRRELRILAWHCGIGAGALAAVAASGILFPRNTWAVVGLALLGAWLGFAVYRLRSDSLV